MKINKKEFLNYEKATNYTKSFLINDWKKSNLSIEKFLYITENYEKLKEMYGNKSFLKIRKKE